MTLAEARAIGGSYDLDVVAIDALSAGSVNSNFRVSAASGEAFFLRVYEEQNLEGAALELQVIRELSESGVPTPPPRARRDGGYVTPHRGKPVGLHPWVEGDSLCFGRVTRHAVRHLGRALARVHRCGAALSHVPEGRFGLQGLRERLDAVDRTDRRFAPDTIRIRERMAHYAACSSSALPQGLIHGDLFRDNVLWRGQPGADQHGAGPELVALLDFESASQGVFVYDIMVCVHAWCYGAAFDLDLVRALLAGYHEERPLLTEELAALEAHGALAALRFATTRLTDFSLRAPPGQPPARDYRRFLARLEAIEAGLLTPIIKEVMR